MKAPYKIGAIFYILWGLLHVVGASSMLFTLYGEGGMAALAVLGSNLSASELPAQTSPVVDGLYAFHSWNILWAGLMSLVVAVKLNWHNSRLGYWINLAIVSIADIGLILTLILPGYMPISDGFLGPVFWIGAFVYSTLGLMRENTIAAQPAVA